VGDPDKPSVPFGELFDDDDVQQHYEGLAATLKAAKKRELLTLSSVGFVDVCFASFVLGSLVIPNDSSSSLPHKLINQTQEE
jgi:hypothetical protein